MATGGGARAWEFLKRNAEYSAAWLGLAPAPDAHEDAPFPIRRQAQADRALARFGLLAREDPFAALGPASPFWEVAPMLEAWPADGPGLVALAREAGATLAGLRLDDGTLILKVERAGRALQIRIADGAGFDLHTGTVEVRLRFARSWPRGYARTGDLWRVAGIPAPRGGRGPGIGKYCLRWTDISPGRPRARSRSCATGPSASRGSGSRTVRCARRCATASSAAST